jgi:hypothetical protein
VDEDAIGAFGNLDEKRVGVALAGVVLEEPGAETACFDTDGVVHGGIVGGVAVEDVDGDAVLLERLVGMGDGVVKDVSEEELTAPSIAEGARAEDAVELGCGRAVAGKRRESDVARLCCCEQADRTRKRAGGGSWHGRAPCALQGDESASWPT